MTTPVIIDAGPALNFCSVNKERLLISVVGKLHAPETVSQEVKRKAASPTDRRFERAGRVWGRLEGSQYLTVLSDDASNAALVHALTRISGQPFATRSRQAKDLGELMVVAHASVRAEAGAHVTVLIDDGEGRQMAAGEADRLLMRPPAGVQSPGRIYLLSSIEVLRRAIGSPHMPDRAAMRSTYERLRQCDDGLAPIEQTDLLDPDRWTSRAAS